MSNITINIKGQFVSLSGKNAGGAGNANATVVQFVFDKEWDGFGKRVIWCDAKGENEVSVLLVPQIAEITSVYTSYIPASVMKCAGWCSFTVEGYYESEPQRVQKSVSEKLFVAYSQSDSQNDMKVSEAMQLHTEFEALMPAVNALMEDTKENVTLLCDNINKWEEYSEQGIYRKGNKVSFNGECYVCINDVSGVSPENKAFWLLIAKRGEQGIRGIQGPQGVRGEKGEKGDRGDKGDKGEQGIKGDAGINAVVAPVNGFYSFSVDEDGQLWVNYPDEENPPQMQINENNELIITIPQTSCSYNVGKVKGENGYTPQRGIDYWTSEDIEKLNIPNEKVNALNSYEDMNVVPSDESLFTFKIDDETMTASVTFNGEYDESIAEYLYEGEIVIPYEYVVNEKSYLVTKIEDKAFYRGTGITGIIIPESVNEIGESAFEDCFSLNKVNIPKIIKKLEQATFAFCRFCQIKIPVSVEKIDTGAFPESSLTDVYFEGTKAQWEAIEIGEDNGGLLNAVIHYDWVTPTKETENLHYYYDKDIEINASIEMLGEVDSDGNNVPLGFDISCADEATVIVLPPPYFFNEEDLDIIENYPINPMGLSTNATVEKIIIPRGLDSLSDEKLRSYFTSVSEIIRVGEFVPKVTNTVVDLLQAVPTSEAVYMAILNESDERKEQDNIILQKATENANETEELKITVNTMYSDLSNVQNLADSNAMIISDLQKDMGDIETALDNIIAIQNTLTGGEDE